MGGKLAWARTARDWLLQHPALSGFAAFFLLALGSRIVYMQAGISQDTAGYLYVGETILDGGAPYVDAAEPKGPVLHLLFAGISLISGHSVLLVHSTLVVFMGLAALAVAGYVARFCGRAAGLLAGCIVATIGSASALGGYDPNTEQYGIALLASAWYLAARGTRRSALAAGALTAAATLANLGFIVIVPIVAFELWRSGRDEERRHLLIVASIGAGALTLAISCWIAAHGALDDMKVQMWDYARAYSNGNLRHTQPADGAASLRNLTNVLEPRLWIAAIVGSALACTNSRLRAPAMGALLWIALMWARIKVPSLSGSVTWPHHYYTAVPGIAVGITVGIVTIWGASARRRLLTAGLVLAVPLYAYVVAPQIRDLEHPARTRFWTAAEGDYALAEFVRENTAPSDPVFAVYDQAQLYWLSDRRASTRWFVDYGLEAEPHYAAERASDFRANPPVAIMAKGYVLPAISYWTEVMELVSGPRYERAYHNQANGDTVWLLK